MAGERAPRTLLEAVTYFADKDRALNFFVALRWADGVTCPSCGSKKAGFLQTRRIWKCKDCKRQFSAKVGTIFEDSPIGLEKWLPALWMIANCKNGISSYELARALGVTQKTAWFMLHRIRLAMQAKSFTKMGGEIEVDETFIGGKARFMHKDRRERVIKGKTGAVGKVAVMGLLNRHGSDGHSTVRTAVVPNVRRHKLQTEIRRHVLMDGTSTVYTDALKSYEQNAKWGPTDTYIHKVIDHAEAYVDGAIHTNGMENFWSLLKRTIKGTYVSVEPFHLFRYLDEQAHRFNNRGGTDASRFADVLQNVTGKRLTYEALTGGTLEGERP
jgi:transposase-like protein